MDSVQVKVLATNYCLIGYRLNLTVMLTVLISLSILFAVFQAQNQ